MRVFTFLIGLVILSGALYSQPHPFPLNNDLQQVLLASSPDTTFNFHQSVRPFTEDELPFLNGHLLRLTVENKGKFLDALLNSRPSDYRGDELSLELSPIVQAMSYVGTSNDSSDGGSWLGIGAAARLTIGKKLAVGGDYTYSKLDYPSYVQAFSRQWGVVPGIGAIDSAGQTNHYYNFYLSYSPAEFVNIEVGRGKHFIGHGYRSLLLSDNSNSYPYARIQLKLWKFKYQVLYSAYRQIQGVESSPEEYRSKYSTSNYLGMNFGKHFQAGLFQSIIWQGQNGDFNRGFDVNYLNPVVFMRPVEFSVGSPDNVLLGVDLAYQFLKKYTIYSQVVLDEFLLEEIRAGNGWWANKYGIQLGFKAIDLLNIKGLAIQLEHNQVRPFTYSHNDVIQNYGHFNQALAHPLGSNFYEGVCRLTYTKKRWLFAAHFVEAIQGLDPLGKNFGGDIFKSNTTRESGFGNFTGQGLTSRLSYQQFKASYLVNPASRLMFEIGITNRQRITQENQSEFNQFIQVGFKTAIFNQYMDF
ncbi:MAG: hypothetical protein RH916_08715 [Vicingaceae bacterium]